MQKTVVRNPNQSSIRRNLLNIAGISVQGETIAPQNGDRLLGGYGVAWLNNQDAASQTTGQDNPLPECNCESGGGGGGGGSGGGGGVQPSGNCEKKNISELKQVLDDYAAQSFCDKEFPDVQFSTFLGYDKPPSNSTAKEIELRMLCPRDDCSDGTFWSSGRSVPTVGGVPLFEYEGEPCAGLVKVKKMTSCEIFEKHKQLFYQEIANYTIPCECSEFRFTARVSYYNTVYYEQYGYRFPTQDDINEFANAILNNSPTGVPPDSSFTLYCQNNNSCTPSGSYITTFNFKQHVLTHYYEDTCRGVSCSPNCDNCNHDSGKVDYIYESCCGKV